MKLGFDLDEVIVNICDEIAKYLRNTYNFEWDTGTYSFYDLSNINFSEDYSLNAKIVADLVEKVNDHKFQATAKPFKGASEGIKKLKRAGHIIHYVSARNMGEEYEVAKWLRKYSIPFDSINNVGRQREKGVFGRILNLDFYMDDLEENLESMLKYKKRWRKGLALFTRPWNEDSIDASKFIRLDDWTQVSRHLGIHKR